MSREVIVSGPAEIHKFYQDNFPQWDCQSPCLSVNDIWDGLKDEWLSDKSDIVILTDVLYETEPELFAATVAQFAPAALVLILSYDSGLIDDITADIHAQQSNIEYRAQFGRNVPFTFIPSDIAVGRTEEAVLEYDTGADAVEDFQKASNAVAIEVDDSYNNHHEFGRNGKIFTVTSSKGGSGKSTVALLTGATLALSSKKAYDEGRIDEPLRVCVVDLDTFDGQLGFVLNQSMPTSLNIALANTPMDEQLVWNNLIYSERMGFHALLAPVRGVTARYTDAHFYTKVINMLRSMFDVVILDTSVQHYDDIIKSVALPLADAVLLVTTLDMKSVKGMARWMKVASEPTHEGGHNLDLKKVGVVVNGSLHNVGIGKDELVVASMGAKNLANIPLDTTAVQSAGNAGRLEELLYMHEPISDSYRRLCEKIVNLLDRKVELVPLAQSFDEPEPAPAANLDKKPSNNRNRRFFGRGN